MPGLDSPTGSAGTTASNGSQPSGPTLPQPGPSTYSRAPKGKACLNCRRRKLKCDCARPVCSQCARYGRERDCEYSDKDQRSRTEILEETIAILQARLAEFEHPDESSSRVGLRPTRTWKPCLEDTRELHTSPRGSRSPELMTAPEPSFSEAQALIEAFLPYSPDLGFFLNPTRFLSWASRRFPSSYPSVPDPYFASTDDGGSLLLCSVYVWGAALTNNPDLKQHSDGYLKKAIHLASVALRGGGNLARTNVVHIIQAEILLAKYFFNSGLFIEGRQHAATAVSLVLSHGLHKIASHTLSDPSQMRLIPAADIELSLPPALDRIEEGERICAFWQVYILDKTWSAVLGRPSLLVENGTISSCVDTPWPLATEQYVEGPMPHDYGVGGRTVQRFLSDMPTFQVGPRIATLALRAQAAALLDRAMWLSSACASDPQLREFHNGNFESTEALLNKFILFVTSLSNTQAQHSPDWIRSLAVTQCIARFAVVQLQVAFLDVDLKYAVKALSAAKAILATIQSFLPMNFRQVDPLLSVLLTASARIMFGELAREQNPSLYKRQMVACTNTFYLAHCLGEAADALNNINRDSRLSVLQLDTVHSLRTALSSS